MLDVSLVCDGLCGEAANAIERQSPDDARRTAIGAKGIGETKDVVVKKVPVCATMAAADTGIARFTLYRPWVLCGRRLSGQTWLWARAAL